MPFPMEGIKLVGNRFVESLALHLLIVVVQQAEHVMFLVVKLVVLSLSHPNRWNMEKVLESLYVLVVEESL